MRYENLKTHTDTHTQHYHQLEATKAHKATLSTLEHQRVNVENMTSLLLTR